MGEEQAMSLDSKIDSLSDQLLKILLILIKLPDGGKDFFLLLKINFCGDFKDFFYLFFEITSEYAI